MRTGSPRNAVFNGQHWKEYAWSSIADSLPMAAVSAEDAAQQILRACQNGDAQVIVKNPGSVGVLLQSLFPGATRTFLTVANRFLSRMGGIGQQAARGYESESS